MPTPSAAAFTDPVVEETDTFSDPVVDESDTFTDPVVEEDNPESQPGFLRRAVSETLTQLADVGRQGAAGVVRDLPRMLWNTAAAVLPGETPSAANPQGSGAAGFAGQTVEEIDSREQGATWDDPLRSGAAGIPGAAARSLAPNLLAAFATRGESAKIMPFIYGASRGQEIFRKMRDKAAEEGTEFSPASARLNAFAAGGLEGGLEYVSSLFGLGKAAKEFGAALRTGKVAAAPEFSKGLAAGLRKLAGEMLSEGGTEFVQEGGGELHEQLLGISDAVESQPESILDVDWGAVGEMAALGAGAGMLAAGAAGGAHAAARPLIDKAQARQALREALAGSTGAAADAERASFTDPVVEEPGERQKAEGGGQTGTGEDGGTNTEAEREIFTDPVVEEPGAQTGAPAAGPSAFSLQPSALPPARADGATVQAVEERDSGRGRKVPAVKMLMPDGKFLWSMDPGEVAVAEYWLKDRVLFPSAPAGDAGRQTGEPRVNASRRAGFDMAPGKSVLVLVGRSKKSYPAKVVEVLDDTHVRVRISKIQRALKNNREGYADVDVRQVMQYKSAEIKTQHEEELRKAGLNQSERVAARDAAREFRSLIENGEEFLDQRALEAADRLTGKASGTAKSEELHKAYVRAAAMLDTADDLSTPLGQARALPRLQEYLKKAEGERQKAEGGLRTEAGGQTPEGGVRKQLNEMTPKEFDAAAEFVRQQGKRTRMVRVDNQLHMVNEQKNGVVTETREVITGRIHKEILQGIAEQLQADINDAHPDSVASTKNWAREKLKNPERYRLNAAAVDAYGIKLPSAYVREGDFYVYPGEQSGVLANEEPAPQENRGAKAGQVPKIGGHRITPHETYNTDASAGMEGDGRTAAPVAEGMPGVGMDLRDAVSLYRELRGLIPRIRKSLNGRALGWYKIAGREIELLADVFGLVDKRDAQRMRDMLAERGMTPEEIEQQMPVEINALVEIRRNTRMKMPVKLLTHELGHLIDALPDDMVRGRGNILGHVAALHRYLKQTLPREPGAPDTVTKEDKARLWSEAEKMAEADLGKARVWVEEIKTEVAELARLPVSAEDIKGILGLDGKEKTPELYAWFARQDDATKKDVLRQAMKGLVDEKAAGGAVREIRRVVVTGTRMRSETGYSREDVAKRFKELLRKAVEDLQLIERGQIVAEAKAAIPLWRGADGWEKYFEKPEEMYAELFGMFLSDPGWMEAHTPTAFRAYVAYMDARPDAAKAYRQWLNDKQNGTLDAAHVTRLKETWAAGASDDLAKLQHLQRKQTAAQEWQGFRYYLDRRMGPVYASVRNLKRLANTDIAARVAAGTLTADAALALRVQLTRRAEHIVAGVKDVLHHQNTIRLMLGDVKGRVSDPLRAAGLDWSQLAEYAFHNRVRFELDGRAAALGWMPETSGKRLEEMRRDMTPAQWDALAGAWKEFRGIYERAVVEMDGMRGMLGDQLHDLIRDNVHYVAFAHVPGPEEVNMTLAEREAAGKDAKARGLKEYDGVTAFDLVASEMERRAGAAGAKIMPLTGSFDPVADPLSATLEKAGRLVNAVYQNRLKLDLRNFARDTPGSAYREAETGTRAGGEKFIREIDDGRFKTLHYMEGGELKAFVADKFVAQAFDGKNPDRIAAIGALMKVNNFISAMYTRLRIGFFEPAYAKDKQAAAANLKGLWRSPLASMPFLGETPFAMVTRYIPEGVRDALPGWLMNRNMLEYYEAQARRVAILIDRGDFDAQLRRAGEIEAGGNRKAAERLRGDVYYARRALGMNVLMAMQDVILPGQGLSAYDRMNAKYGVKQDREAREAGNFLAAKGKQIGTAFVEWYARLGEIRENTTKIASLMYLDTATSMTDDQKKLAVTEFGGSPDFSERGVAAGYFEFMQGAFLNARKEGLVRSFKAGLDHPGDYAMKKMVYSVTPAALRWMVGSGFLIGLMKAAIPDDKDREDNPVYNFLVWARRKMSFVSDYLQKSYAVIPLPVDAGEDCAVVLSLPLDETERAWNDLTYSAMDSLSEALGQDVSKDADPWVNYGTRIFGDFMPSNANGGPLYAAVVPWLNTYGLGRPTFDSFRQRNVLTDDELAARFSSTDAVQALLGNTWNALGGGTIKAWERGKGQQAPMVPIEEFLKWPVIQPVIGRFIRVVRGGQEQLAATIGADETAARIADRLDAKRILTDSMKQGVPLLPEHRARVTSNPYIMDYYFAAYEKQYGKVKGDAFLDLAAKVSDPATVNKLLRKRSELGY